MNKLKNMMKAITNKFPYRKVRRYVVWNPEYTANFNHGERLDSYEKLIKFEFNNGCLSSVIETHDIESLIQAICNETNATFMYHEI